MQAKGDEGAGRDREVSIPAHAAEALTPAVETALTSARRGDGRLARRSPVPSRNATVRARVRQLEPTLGYELTPGDLYALTRWAHMYEKWKDIADKLDAGGVTIANGDPRKLLGEWRALSAELSRLETQLGITAAARAALGVHVGELRRGDLATDLARLRLEREGEGEGEGGGGS